MLAPRKTNCIRIFAENVKIEHVSDYSEVHLLRRQIDSDIGPSICMSLSLSVTATALKPVGREDRMARIQ